MRRRRQKAEQVTSLDHLRGYLAEGIPVLVDLWQAGCQPCRMMEGIVDELADEFSGRAHVLKIDVGRVPGAAQAFGVRSTPTFVVLARAVRPPSKRAKRRAAPAPDAVPTATALNPRWRVSGMVRKDVLAAALVSNGAGPRGVTSAP
jgi:thiol-disulfide isomerase/thioredoxin